MRYLLIAAAVLLAGWALAVWVGIPAVARRMGL